MIGRLLDDRDLRQLQWIASRKKPAAPPASALAPAMMEWTRRSLVPVACGTSERIANANPASIVRCGPTLSKIGVITRDRATDELEAIGIGVRGLRQRRLNCSGQRGRTDQ